MEIKTLLEVANKNIKSALDKINKGTVNNFGEFTPDDESYYYRVLPIKMNISTNDNPYDNALFTIELNVETEMLVKPPLSVRGISPDSVFPKEYTILPDKPVLFNYPPSKELEELVAVVQTTLAHLEKDLTDIIG